MSSLGGGSGEGAEEEEGQESVMHEDLMVPEDIGRTAAHMLLEEISRWGFVLVGCGRENGGMWKNGLGGLWGNVE
jgi:hypothetical protein